MPGVLADGFASPNPMSESTSSGQMLPMRSSNRYPGTASGAAGGVERAVGRPSTSLESRPRSRGRDSRAWNPVFRIEDAIREPGNPSSESRTRSATPESGEQLCET
jgi:hypothetical protein